VKNTCFDKKVPHSFMQSGKFLVCANCGKKRGPKRIRPYPISPPKWAEAWKDSSEE